MEPATFQHRVTIEATPSKVFAALTDLDQVQTIMPSIVNVERLSEGDFGKGTKWKETRRFKVLGFIPLRASATIEVAEFTKNKRYATVADDGCNWACYTFTTKSAGKGQTEVVLDAAFKLLGKHAAKSSAPARAQKMSDWCEKADGDLLTNLKAHVEAA